MKKTIIILLACAGIVSCNNHDTSRAGVQDSASKVSLDDPKAVVTDSSKLAHDSSAANKDPAH